MAPESPDDIDRRLKELDREKREEELRQLRANARTKWVTPTALAAMLPLLGGIALWAAGEAKQYSEAHQALKDRDKLEKERAALLQQKDSLNQEIDTLLHLKEHYATQARQLKEESETKQEAVDKLYLRARWMTADTVYALDHIKGMGPKPDKRVLDALRADAKSLPKESATQLNEILQRYDLMETIILLSREGVASFNKALDLIPASDWARRLTPLGPDKDNLMVGTFPEGRRYYDLSLGRFLTKEEVEKQNIR
jgi:hypothetical protein